MQQKQDRLHRLHRLRCIRSKTVASIGVSNTQDIPKYAICDSQIAGAIEIVWIEMAATLAILDGSYTETDTVGKILIL
jgi:hypothetical protein